MRKKSWVIIVLIALLAGILGQFIWKMIYFPEPIIPVIIELSLITAMTLSAIVVTRKLRK